MKLLGFLHQDAIILDMKATTKEDAIRELIDEAVKHGEVAEQDREAVYQQVLEREKRGTTGLGDGLAVPHVKDCKNVQGLTGAFGRSKRGIPFQAVDGNPVKVMFLILGGEGTAGEHIQVLRSLASLRQNEHFLRFLRDARDREGVVDVIREMMGSVA